MIAKRLLFLGGLLGPLFFLLAVCCARAEEAPESALREMTKSVELAGARQKDVDRLTADRARQLAELDELESRSLWLRHQLGKYATYMDERERALEELGRRQREAERIRVLLEPYLDAVCTRLAVDLRTGPQFLMEERTARIHALRSVLDDCDTPLGEKLRRVLEALFIEAQYGSELSAEDAVIDRESSLPAAAEAIEADAGALEEGRDASVRALLSGRTLRVGRGAEYFLSRDGSCAFVHSGDGRWVPLGAESAGQLILALRMVDREQLPGFVLLPTEAR